MKLKHWQKDEEDYIKTNFQNTTIRELSRHLDRSYQSVQHKCYRLGLRKFELGVSKIKMYNLPKDETIYLAGFFDGEGCITFGTKDYGEAPQVILNNVSDQFIALVEKIGVKVSLITPSKNQPYYHMSLTSFPSIKDFLEGLIPFLRIKKEEALLMLEFCNSRLLNLRQPRTEREKTIVKLIKGKHSKGKHLSYKVGVV